MQIKISFLSAENLKIMINLYILKAISIQMNQIGQQISLGFFLKHEW